jgi:hypothetical protein
METEPTGLCNILIMPVLLNAPCTQLEPVKLLPLNSGKEGLSLACDDVEAATCNTLLILPDRLFVSCILVDVFKGIFSSILELGD